MIERLSASVAARQLACHASANLELAIPGWVPPMEDPDADNAANRGTKMHDLMAQVLALPLGDAKNFAAALAYITEVMGRRRFKKMIEQPVTANWLRTRPSTTADLVLYVKDEIHVIDLKTGKIPVEVVENDQLLYYGAAYGYLAPEADGVHLHIVQPWADGNMAEWFAPASRVQQFMWDTRQAERMIQGGDTAFGPSDHCKFCPANPHSRGDKGHPLCPAMMGILYPPIFDEEEMLRGL